MKRLYTINEPNLGARGRYKRFISVDVNQSFSSVFDRLQKSWTNKAHKPFHLSLNLSNYKENLPNGILHTLGRMTAIVSYHGKSP